MKTLIFEGAGWADADSSKAADVGNCRIRTRIRNNTGRIIYLEMGGFKYQGKAPKCYSGYNVAGHVDHCFYCDSKWDLGRNYSKELAYFERISFEYNKANILKLVNEHLNCSFEGVKVVNDGSIRVFATNEPLCDCSNGLYEPFKEIEININELTGVEPLRKFEGFNYAQYELSYNDILKIEPLRKWIEKQSEYSKQPFKNYTYVANLRWDSNGIITSLEITSLSGSFCCMGLGAEELPKVIELIISSHESKELAGAV